MLVLVGSSYKQIECLNDCMDVIEDELGEEFAKICADLILHNFWYGGYKKNEGRKKGLKMEGLEEELSL